MNIRLQSESFAGVIIFIFLNGIYNYIYIYFFKLTLAGRIGFVLQSQVLLLFVPCLRTSVGGIQRH